MGCAADDLDRDAFRLHRFRGNSQLHHTGFTVQWLVLVEDEVAYAVVDRFTLIGLYGLQRVGMVADECVGTRVNEPVSL